MTEDDYAAVARRCANHVGAWAGTIGCTPEILAANIHDYRILDDNSRIRICVLLTKDPGLAVTTEHGVRWYRRDLAPAGAWSAAA